MIYLPSEEARLFQDLEAMSELRDHSVYAIWLCCASQRHCTAMLACGLILRECSAARGPAQVTELCHASG